MTSSVCYVKKRFFLNLDPYQSSFNAEKIIEIQSYGNQSVQLKHGWEGRIQKLSGAPNDPATWAEIHFNAWQNITFADSSLIRGYNGSMLFTSTHGTLHTGITNDLWTEAPQKFKEKDSHRNDVLAATEPHTGGRNNELVDYYRRRITKGNAYLIPDDHHSSHCTKDTHINLENGGNNPLIANRSDPGQWERFDLIHLNEKKIALRSHANRKYVCAENGGNGPLIANRSEINGWETFELIRLREEKIVLIADNRKYICADNFGNSELIANRDNVNDWETFDLVQQ